MSNKKPIIGIEVKVLDIEPAEICNTLEKWGVQKPPAVYRRSVMTPLSALAVPDKTAELMDVLGFEQVRT